MRLGRSHLYKQNIFLTFLSCGFQVKQKVWEAEVEAEAEAGVVGRREGTGRREDWGWQVPVSRPCSSPCAQRGADILVPPRPATDLGDSSPVLPPSHTSVQGEVAIEEWKRAC